VPPKLKDGADGAGAPKVAADGAVPKLNLGALSAAPPLLLLFELKLKAIFLQFWKEFRSG
jgi:hypothetical protein